MPDLLLDTDVVIDHIRGHRFLAVPRDRAAYSTLTRAELYAGVRADETVLDALLAGFVEIPVDRVIAEEGGRIRRSHGIDLADAIIAATAITTGRTLVTRNERHVRGVRGLKVRRPRP
ncbi:MAG: PIN domain-containing protein [Acidobacteria bacterium]|nr:PIN domain-containing protein [Acidobacteriota bacterium]